MKGESKEYEPRQYWEDKLSQSFSTKGAGLDALSVSYNNWALKAGLRSLTRCLLSTHPSLRNREYTKNLEVLDVGCGTGAYIRYWKNLGITYLTGVDITSVSVRNLRKTIPNVRFHLLDITNGNSAKNFAKRFDIISVMNVLLHITDDEKFIHAISNISKMLKQDGILLIADPIVLCNYWGKTFTKESSSKCRPLKQYLKAFTTNGLAVVRLCPASFFMSDPIDTNSKTTFQIWRLIWHIISIFAKRETTGAIEGRILYTAEGLLIRVFNHAQYGPTGKFLIARKK